MGKRIYVNGGILITTPFFAYKNAGASYDLPPENSEIIEPNTITETGEPYLEISNEQKHSLQHNIHLLIFLQKTLSDHIMILSKELMKSKV